MTSSTNSLQNNRGRSKHTFWTWIIAVMLAIYLFWQWQHGHGPTAASSCCSGTITVPFNFTATSANGYNATGDASNVKWLEKSLELSAWLQGGVDWKLAGDAHNVTLTGTVDSEEIKLAKGAEAKALFGVDVKVDNQLSVKMAEATPAEVAIPATSPTVAKLYFDTAKASLPANAVETLAPIIEWLKANESAKAIISGYHDSSGNLAFNQALSKSRAKSVSGTLENAGIDVDRIELRKPTSTKGVGDAAEARRVEVSVE